MSERDAQSAPSLTAAIERVLATSQRVLVDRIELLRIEAREDVATAIRGAVFGLGGAILLFYGWIVLVALVAYLAWGSVPLGAALGLLTAFHLVGGAALVWLCGRTLGGIRPLRPDDEATDRRERQALSGGVRGAA
jgi:uncharacterized membrane protein YqjE